MSRFVVKVGGHALDDLNATSAVLSAMAHDLSALVAEGHEIVLVHGGGPQIADVLHRVGHESSFYEGLRITSRETMTYVSMALASVNLALVAALSHAGLACVGMCGVDGTTIRGQSLGEPWDRAGTVTTVNCALIEVQWRAGFLPVFSPVIVDTNGELLNCNADHVAGALAGAVRASTLVLLSDIDQLRSDPDEPTSALTRVNVSEVRDLIASGAARDGMRPKMMAALDALDAGAQRVVVANGLRAHALRDVVHDRVPTTEVVP